MRKIIALFLLCFAIPCAAEAGDFLYFKKRPTAGGTCATQSVDVSLTTNNTNSIFYSSDERGQSWTAGVSKTLYSLTFYRTDSGTGYTQTIRIGTSTNLTSPLVEYTCSMRATAGSQECIIPEAGRPALTASTAYYVGIHTGGQWSIARDSAGGYAGGTGYFDATSSDWTLSTTSVSDLYFITKMCD